MNEPQLPYKLSEGVTATREGLVISEPMYCALYSLAYLQAPFERKGRVIPWADVAERLRYREGEPWCWLDGHKIVLCDSDMKRVAGDVALHRLAAILVDDAEAFRVLHYCVTNLGNREEDNDG